MQREHVTADQQFESVVLMPNKPCRLIRQSFRRLDPEKTLRFRKHVGSLYLFLRIDRYPRIHWRTFLVVVSGLISFVFQFQGLRFSNWSCSIAQLIAIAIATILRAITRRGMRERPMSRLVLDGHQLDDLSLRIINDGPGFVEAGTFSKPFTSSFEFTDAEPMNARPVQPSSPGDAIPLQQSPNTTHWDPDLPRSPKDNAQRALKLRERLGRITRWQGPKFDEAVVLANAIEAAVNALQPKYDGSIIVPLEVRFGMEVIAPEGQQETIEFTLTKCGDSSNGIENDKIWTVNTAELEAALSLAAFCVSSANSDGNEFKTHGLAFQNSRGLDRFDWLRAVYSKRRASLHPGFVRCGSPQKSLLVDRGFDDSLRSFEAGEKTLRILIQRAEAGISFPEQCRQAHRLETARFQFPGCSHFLCLHLGYR